jgi:pimeloyl-ACP methyl ester carboxylesterase
VLGSLVVLGAMSCGPKPQSAKGARFRAQLEPCRVPNLGEVALCGDFEVPEDRSRDDGPRISLRVILVPARTGQAAPDPLFLLAGGPGQSITRVGPMLVRRLSDVRKKRDIVLVDQRGTGESNPIQCDDDVDRDDLAQLLKSEVVTSADVEECLATFEGDPRHYTTPAAVDDLFDVSAALGYDQINLWGGSYGTRVALVALRRHEDRVRSVVLDGVAPPSMPLPLFAARDAQSALDRLFDSCAADEACASAYPDLRGDFDALLVQLEGPRRVRVPHARTGVMFEVEMTRDIFAGGLRGLLYSADASSLIPLVIRRGLDDDFGAFLTALISTAEQAQDSMSNGLMLSVMCAEDLPRYGEGEQRRESMGSFLGDAMVREFRSACAVWPHDAAEPGFGDHVVSAVPALLLSGQLDPITPPLWAEATAAHLPHSLHVVAPGVGHGVASLGCVPRLIADFIEAADVADLDPECTALLERPPFFLDFAGPHP